MTYFEVLHERNVKRQEERFKTAVGLPAAETDICPIGYLTLQHVPEGGILPLQHISI